MHTYTFLCILLVKLVNSIAGESCNCLWYRFEWDFIFVYNNLQGFLILKQPHFYQKVFNVGCFCFSLLQKKFIIVFIFVMASTAKCISERRAQLIQQWIPSVLTLAAQPSPPQLYEVTAGSKSDKHHLCFISFFLSFWKTFCIKTRIFFFLLVFIGTSHLSLDKIQLWNLGAVSSQNWNDSRLVFPGWIRFNNERNFIHSPGGKNGLRLDQEINLSNEKGGMNLYCPRNKLCSTHWCEGGKSTLRRQFCLLCLYFRPHRGDMCTAIHNCCQFSDSNEHVIIFNVPYGCCAAAANLERLIYFVMMCRLSIGFFSAKLWDHYTKSHIFSLFCFFDI